MSIGKVLLLGKDLSNFDWSSRLGSVIDALILITRHNIVLLNVLSLSLLALVVFRWNFNALKETFSVTGCLSVSYLLFDMATVASLRLLFQSSPLGRPDSCSVLSNTNFIVFCFLNF